MYVDGKSVLFSTVRLKWGLRYLPLQKAGIGVPPTPKSYACDETNVEQQEHAANVGYVCGLQRTLVIAMAPMFWLNDVIPVPVPNIPASTQPTPSIAIPSK